MRDEVNGIGIRVGAIYPGRTATPRISRVFEAEQRDYDAAKLLQPEDVAAQVLHLISAPPHVEITDVHLRPRERTY